MPDYFVRNNVNNSVKVTCLNPATDFARKWIPFVDTKTEWGNTIIQPGECERVYSEGLFDNLPHFKFEELQNGHVRRSVVVKPLEGERDPDVSVDLCGTIFVEHSHIMWEVVRAAEVAGPGYAVAAVGQRYKDW